MEITLLGTGDAAGWPHPFCSCASCTNAYAEGEIRAHTSVLVDGVLLLDCGHDVARSAVRLRVDLRPVRHIVITNDHDDQVNASLLLSRQRAGCAEPLDVFGPPGALDEIARALPAPISGVTFHPLAPGDVAEVGTYTVRALAAHTDGALVYDVADQRDRRLLYASDTGPGFELPDDARYDVVLLEETSGDSPAAEVVAGHHNLTSFPQTLARLRALRAIDARTRVVAVHLGHGNPAPSVLRARLSAWGAEVLPDGAVITVGQSAVGTHPTGRPKMAHRMLILGGARSGKSATAERLLAAEPAVCYVATAQNADDDAEWTDRIAAHRARRPASWSTVETTDLAAVLRGQTASDPPVLIDCLTVWLARMMDAVGIWSAIDDVAAKTAEVALAAAIDDLLAAWRSTSARVVAVSNEVGSGVVPEYASGRRFRDELGALNARLASQSDDVVLVTAGIARSLLHGGVDDHG